jgi:HK97 family phage portal protein
VDLCLWGNAYAVIVRNSRRQVIELHRVKPEAVSVKRDEASMEPVYEVSQKNGPVKRYSFADVLHLKWLSVDGLVGESPTGLAKEEIQLALGLQRYAARIAGRGGRPQGFIKTTRPVNDTGLEKLRKAFVATITGKDASDEIPILSDADFIKVAFTAVEMELQALSQQTMRRILAIYRIPPPIAGDYEESTYSNAEHAGRMFLTHSLMPHLKQLEAEIWAKCLTPAERKNLYVEHLVDDIVRADIAQRFEAYAKAVTNGILNPNEVRAMENRPSYAGGEQFRLPMNTENPNAGGEADAA